MQDRDRSLTLHDIAGIVIGSAVLAFPVAAAEEIWDLGEQLSALRVGLIALSSIVFIGGFVYLHYEHDSTPTSLLDFVKRVGATYLVTLFMSALILSLVDQFPIMLDSAVAVKRTVLVAFPASFAATVVDSLT